MHPSGNTAPQRWSQLSIWSLVVGVVAIPLAGCVIFTIGAILLGHFGLGETRAKQLRGRRLAIAGLVLGYASVAVIVASYVIIGINISNQQ